VSGTKIGCQRGTTGDSYISDTLTAATDVQYDNGALACKALGNGQVDAVIIDLEPAKLYCKNISGIAYLSSVLTEEEYAIALAKNNSTLLELDQRFHHDDLQRWDFGCDFGEILRK
jgi:ABC-type amino acid transport substrate-binding protein